jgi:hypothetical protein
MQTLQNMLINSHSEVGVYKQAYELTCNMPREQKCTITLHFDAAYDKRHYNAPDASVKEIAVLLLGDGDEVKSSQNIIIHRRHGDGLQHISDCHPFYPCLCYILLFPTGQLGWHPAIPYEEVECYCLGMRTNCQRRTAAATVLSSGAASLTICVSFMTLVSVTALVAIPLLSPLVIGHGILMIGMSITPLLVFDHHYSPLPRFGSEVEPPFLSYCLVSSIVSAKRLPTYPVLLLDNGYCL